MAERKPVWKGRRPLRKLKEMLFEGKASKFHFILSIVSLGLCMYFQFFNPPGPSKALLWLGVVAALMILADMKLAYRGVYVFLVLWLAFIENRAINRDRQEFEEHRSNREQIEDKKFGDLITKGTTMLDKQNTAQQDLGRAAKVLGQTATAIHDVYAETTGGNSFAVVTPQLRYGKPQEVPLIIRNHGEHQLTGVTVVIYDTRVPDYKSPLVQTPLIHVGSLHPHESRPLNVPFSIMGVTEEAATIYPYKLEISAQNFTVEEFLTFRRGGRVDWDYEYRVIREAPYKLYEEAQWNDENR